MAALFCPAPTAPTTMSSTESQQSATEKLTISFCPCTKRIAVSVRRCNGDDYKYVFDEEANAFKPLNCVSCQPRITETDLYPFYSVYHAGASQFVTFVYNVITNLCEQYVYNPEMELLEQVVVPDLLIDYSRHTISDLLYTIDTDKGQVVIRKDRNGNFMKERFQKELQMYVPMRSDYVKTIPLEERKPGTASEERKERPRLSIEYDPHTNQKVIFVTKSRKLLSVFSYNFRTAQFEMLHSDSSLSEMYLYPKCVSFSKSINKNVIHAKNGMTGEMEKFIYSDKTRGFEQVRVSDIVYDPVYDSKSDVMMVVPDADDDTKPIVIARHAAYGYFLKYQINPNSLQYEVMPPVEVRFLSVAKQDELILYDPDQDAKKGWDLVQDLAARAVQKTLDDVNQMLDKTIVAAVESGKVPPNLSEQRGLAVVLKALCIKHTQEAMRKYDTTLAKVNLITVDEILESEAEDKSSGVSSDAISVKSQRETSSSVEDDEMTESEELDSSKDLTVDSDIVGGQSIVTSASSPQDSDGGDSDDASTGGNDPDESKSNEADPKEEKEDEAEASKENSLVIVTDEEEENAEKAKEESKPAKNPDDEDVDSDTSMIDMTEFDEVDDSEEDERPPQFFHAG
ncbi:unnamed protein product [Caenorhabditis brenneri]